MITFFECGQGDSAYIKEINLLVDLGEKQPKNNSVSGYIDLMISHSHDDHINGTELQNCNIQNLYLPAYLPECFEIISKLKKKKTLCIPKNIVLVYENLYLYNNKLKILNPPINPWDYSKKVNKVTIDDVNLFLSKTVFEKNYFQNLHLNLRNFFLTFNTNYSFFIYTSKKLN